MTSFQGGPGPRAGAGRGLLRDAPVRGAARHREGLQRGRRRDGQLGQGGEQDLQVTSITTLY